MCQSEFKEAHAREVRLNDDCPMYLAKMLIYVYSGDYPHSPTAKNFSIYEKLLKVAGSEGSNRVCGTMFDCELAIHANMCGIADKFGCMELKELARDKFDKTIKLNGLKTRELLTAVPEIYDGRCGLPESDRSFKDWITYKCQLAAKKLERLPAFIELLRKEPDFAVDFSTRCARKNYVWCPRCKEHIDLVNCACGHTGLCGDVNCLAQRLDVLQCTSCKTSRILMLDPPEEDMYLLE